MPGLIRHDGHVMPCTGGPSTGPQGLFRAGSARKARPLRATARHGRPSWPVPCACAPLQAAAEPPSPPACRHRRPSRRRHRLAMRRRDQLLALLLWLHVVGASRRYRHCCHGRTSTPLLPLPIVALRPTARRSQSYCLSRGGSRRPEPREGVAMAAGRSDEAAGRVRRRVECGGGRGGGAPDARAEKEVAVGV